MPWGVMESEVGQIGSVSHTGEGARLEGSLLRLVAPSRVRPSFCAHLFWVAAIILTIPKATKARPLNAHGASQFVRSRPVDSQRPRVLLLILAAIHRVVIP